MSSLGRHRCVRWRRSLPAVLAAALVHQLGACPCGCLDGNLWVQQARQVAGRTADPTPRPASEQTPPCADHACDETANVLIADGERGPLEDTTANPLIAWIGKSTSLANRSFGMRAGAPQAPSPDGRPPAPTLRIQSQLLLI
ncbi:MAG: hypothetical protein KF688_11700 [Pirellulales bacterium]|nr:hypothetical protein [Pirellulales bacterium]